jgi:hypothetical protein
MRISMASTPLYRVFADIIRAIAVRRPRTAFRPAAASGSRAPEHEAARGLREVVDQANDVTIWVAAFAALDRLLAGRGVLPWPDIDKGFVALGLLEPAGSSPGISRPRKCPAMLSIRTVMPRPGRKVWY